MNDTNCENRRMRNKKPSGHGCRRTPLLPIVSPHKALKVPVELYEENGVAIACRVTCAQSAYLLDLFGNFGNFSMLDEHRPVSSKLWMLACRSSARREKDEETELSRTGLLTETTDLFSCVHNYVPCVAQPTSENASKRTQFATTPEATIRAEVSNPNDAVEVMGSDVLDASDVEDRDLDPNESILRRAPTDARFRDWHLEASSPSTDREGSDGEGEGVAEGGGPFLLSPVESCFLYLLGFLCPLQSGCDSMTSAHQLIAHFAQLHCCFQFYLAAYCHYRGKGWIVRNGSNFGCDFLLYRQGVSMCHSSYGVIVQVSSSRSSEVRCDPCSKQKSSCVMNKVYGAVELAAVCRVLNCAANKQLIVCSVRSKANSSSLGQQQDQFCLSQFQISQQTFNRWLPR